jgi:hypothetical protein
VSGQLHVPAAFTGLHGIISKDITRMSVSFFTQINLQLAEVRLEMKKMEKG